MNVTVQEAVDDLLPPVHVGTGQAKNHARYRLDETTFANVKARLQSQFHVDVGANYPEGTVHQGLRGSFSNWRQNSTGLLVHILDEL
jgi:hypothetical protein